MTELPDLESWPVHPEGVERVLLLRTPPGYVPTPEDCFVCGQPMESAEAGAMAWGIPGRGVAHGDCYEPSEDAAGPEDLLGGR